MPGNLLRTRRARVAPTPAAGDTARPGWSPAHLAGLTVTATCLLTSTVLLQEWLPLLLTRNWGMPWDSIWRKEWLALSATALTAGAAADRAACRRDDAAAKPLAARRAALTRATLPAAAALLVLAASAPKVLGNAPAIPAFAARLLGMLALGAHATWPAAFLAHLGDVGGARGAARAGALTGSVLGVAAIVAARASVVTAQVGSNGLRARYFVTLIGALHLAAAGAFALCARDQSPLPPREDGYDPSEA